MFLDQKYLYFGGNFLAELGVTLSPALQTIFLANNFRQIWGVHLPPINGQNLSNRLPKYLHTKKQPEEVITISNIVQLLLGEGISNVLA